MARSKGKSIGTKSTPTDKYAFGSPAEIANRDKTGFQPRAASFSQIPPTDHGGNLNEPPHNVHSGNFKYSKPVG